MEHSEFIDYLLNNSQTETGNLPALKDLSSQLGISISTLREQLEAAKVLGLVDVKPRRGIRPLPFSFTPAVDASLNFAIKRNRSYFDAFVDLRRHLEYSYFPQAVELLQESDLEKLDKLVKNAWEKLQGRPVRIPHSEHRQLHLTIFIRLDNIFVTGLLEAYWDAYEAVGLNVYTDLDYLEQVWNYHQQLVECAKVKDTERGLRVLQEHFNLMDEMIY
jgi:DNA-binding FadR family transcriptional regulator